MTTNNQKQNAASIIRKFGDKLSESDKITILNACACTPCTDMRKATLDKLSIMFKL